MFNFMERGGEGRGPYKLLLRLNPNPNIEEKVREEDEGGLESSDVSGGGDGGGEGVCITSPRRLSVEGMEEEDIGLNDKGRLSPREESEKLLPLVDSPSLSSESFPPHTALAMASCNTALFKTLTLLPC